jgi:hypothetical protein
LRSLFGAALPTGALLFLGSLAGAIFGADAQSYLEPFLYLLCPAWFFQRFVRIWKTLRSPGMHSWAFCLGLSYSQRLYFCQAYINASAREFFPFAAAIAMTFFISRSIASHHMAAQKLTECVGIFLFETIIFYALLFAIIRFRLIIPQRRDIIRISFPALLPKMMRLGMKFLYRTTGVFSKRVLPVNAAILVQRQAMYLLRMDFFSLVLFPPIAFAISCVLLIFCKGPTGYIGDVSAIIAPFILMIDRTSVFDESAGALVRCWYYTVSEKDRFYANACFSFLFYAPFIALFFSVRIFDFNGNPPDLFFRSLSFLSGAFASAFFMAHRWMYSEWEGPHAAMVATTVLCCLLGCAIPHWGFLFPWIPIAGTWWLSRR